MASRWTARIVIAFLTLEAGLLCNLYAPRIGFLESTEDGIFRGILSLVRNTNSDEVLLEKDRESANWQLRPLSPVEAPEEDWALVQYELAPELFDAGEPAPVEIAFLLSRLHQGGTREIAFTRPLTWPDAEELDLRTLDLALRPFEEVLLPLEVSEVPNPRPFPDWLRASVIPKSSVLGDGTSLPLMNDIMASPSVTPDEDVFFAFPDFGARDSLFRSEGLTPLLARWGDAYIPSWSLAWVMHQLDVNPGDVSIEPGRTLRLGPDGPVIPIDDFGRARMTVANQILPDSISATALNPLEESDLPEFPRRVVLMDGIFEGSRMQGVRIMQEAKALLAMPRPGEAEVFRRLSIGWDVVLYFEIVLVALFALYVRPFSQILSFAIFLLAMAPFVIMLLHLRGLWTPVLPFFVAVFVAWCLVGYLQQIAHPIAVRKPRKSQESEPKVAME